jgi:hypothetical protein
MFCLLLAGLKEDVILLIVLFDQRVKLHILFYNDYFLQTIFCILFLIFSNLSDLDMLLFFLLELCFHYGRTLKISRRLFDHFRFDRMLLLEKVHTWK